MHRGSSVDLSSQCLFCESCTRELRSRFESINQLPVPVVRNQHSARHPAVQRKFFPACQAVAIGPGVNSILPTSSRQPPSAERPVGPAFACYRNPIRRLSRNLSVGMSSSIICSKPPIQRHCHIHEEQTTLSVYFTFLFLVFTFQIIFRKP